MLRLVEILLFLSPFAIVGSAVVLGRRLSAPVTWSLVIFLLALSAGTVWFGLERSLPRGDAYVPARLENGRILPGHGALP